MKNSLFTSSLVKLVITFIATCPFLVQAQMEPVGMEARLIHFMDNLKNEQTESLRSEIQSRQLLNEHNKAWNITHTQAQPILDDAGLEKRAEKLMLKSFQKPIKDSFKEEEKKVAEATRGEFKPAVANNTKNTIKKEVKEELIVRWKIKPERMRGQIEASYAGFTTEAQYQVNGKKMIGTGTTIKDLGISTKVSYEFQNQQTVAALDKQLSDSVTARVSRSTAGTTGLNETKAEVVFSQNF